VALVAAVMVFGALSSVVGQATATPGPDSVGAWSPQIQLGVIGIHAAMLDTGKVLLYELPGSNLGRAVLFDPVSGSTQRVDPQLSWSSFCSGMNLMPDGRLFATGGQSITQAIGFGVSNAVFFDPATSTWTAAPSMTYPRWYPSDVQMPDATILTFGGEKAPTGTDKLVPQVERYNPSTNAWSTLPATADVKGLYPRLVLLPSGKIAKVGPGSPSQLFDPSTSVWTKVGKMAFSPRKAGSFVLLPGLTQVMTSGGQNNSGVVTASTEILDLTAAKPAWHTVGPMHTARMHQNLVLLPNGTVLAVGGGQVGHFGSPVKTAEIFDPATGTWTEMAAQAGQRTYHSTALLLPDGRVLSAGSNSGKPEQTTAEIFSPPYLFSSARPVIDSAPAAVPYGASFDITSAQASSITRVALIKTGTSTHGLDFDQRYVTVPYTVEGNTLHATAPANAAVAPRGTYMLFVVNADGVPSVAPFVQVG